MKNKKFRTRVRLVIVLALILLALVGFAVGKYAQDLSFDGKVTFTASLAQNMILQEHTAQKQSDGSYKLLETHTYQNTYYLIPGLDIPKDPHIIITGKTDIPAYLYIKIQNTTGNSISYTPDDCWKETGTPGVYVYATTNENDEKTAAPITTDLTVYILKGNQISVSQNLLSDGNNTTTLIISAWLEEAVS